MEENHQQNRLAITLRGIGIWLILIVAETIHGITRRVVLVPLVGEFRSNQIGVFTGSIMILAIAFVFVKWLGASRPSDLLWTGLAWVVLTLAFEFLFGRFVVGLSWERLLADYDLLEGGLMSVGILVLGLSPLIAGKLRGIA